MPIQFKDSHERYAAQVLLRGDGEDSVQVSRSTIQFWIQIVVMIITISAWGMSISRDVALQAAQLREQAIQTALQRDKTDMLEKKIELLRYDMSQLQVAVMSGATKKGD